MTYGFRPENWPAFQAELLERAITVADIEKIEFRPRIPHVARITYRIARRSLREW